MADTTPPIDIDAFLAAQDAKDQLRFITCGSVDDGKSTLLGRLLYDSKTVFEDQLAATESESRKYGTQGEKVDLALLVDGLQAEREQGITIDVAYRYFETDRRKFIAADTPGHEQYTRNMATGASTADLAIILIDARKGVLVQTRRHSYIVSLLGIRHVVLAVNKMDLVDYDQATFHAIVAEYRQFAARLGIEDVHAIPLSALDGDNVFEKQGKTPWYEGPTLMRLLEEIEIRHEEADAPFRLPVQWVNRPNLDFRGFAGLIPSGRVKVGDTVAAALTGRTSTVARIVGPSSELQEAVAGQSVTVTLADEIDISRGDVLTLPAEAPQVADQFAAHIIWMDQDRMLPERTYVIRFATAQATAQVTDLTHKVDVNTLDHHAGKSLELNEVGYCKLALDRAVAFDPYRENRATGSFVLIDRFSNATVGAGVISHGLRRASNIEWHNMSIDKQARATANNQKPRVLWFTGLSGSGKSTVADRLEQKLHALGRRTYLLDGDNVRHGLNKDLGFTDADRVENIRRVAEVARLMVDAGLIVLTSFISPFRSERQMARDLVEDTEFVEIFVDTPLEICEQRDPKGLYKKARAGQLKNFTGIDSAYEAPESAEIVLKAGEASPDELADQIIAWLDANA
ncbi:MAG: sulfate adenylyltransferase subunit CysN [Minwuia sp.]|uniref:sulfate adenylyltransferase subunit CysN n=1 Tax=Minwuia sp. TaxID=2493630 RepID=UPI003A86E93E